jgi:cell division protein FtsB
MTHADPLAEARARDTALRHQRVLAVLDQMARTGTEITISSVARAARVHRSFIHRHPDLHAAITAAHHDPEPLGDSTAVSTASLRAEVANLQAQNTRLVRHIAKLERRLSDALGVAVYQASGIGAPDDTAQLQHRITDLEQQLLDLRQQLDERTDDLTAARAANRELMTEVNRR